MPSVQRVKNWYTQSFEELTQFPKAEDAGISKKVLTEHLGDLEGVNNGGGPKTYFNVVKTHDVPQQVERYNHEFVSCIENIKKRHDPVATTLGE
jgi:pyruvate dehydrogenase kinase 2/3/4